MKSAQFQKLVEQLDELSPEQREALAKALTGGSGGCAADGAMRGRLPDQMKRTGCDGGDQTGLERLAELAAGDAGNERRRGDGAGPRQRAAQRRSSNLRRSHPTT